ncbi:MAG: hypothetical protein LBI42_09865, partial [Chitinispirillales bacterium]|nr:hypothetical protein [Chitinispirillales bacterium]
MTAKRLSVAALIMAGLFVQAVFSQVRLADIRVSKTDPDADHTTVQGAVNVAKAGDIIEIIDTDTYNEQVTIDSTKHGLTLRSSNPTSRIKPVIKWQDITNRQPATSAIARNPTPAQEAQWFEQCGAVRVIRAQGVTIDGIAVDGGGPAPFGNASVWCPPQGGNCSNLFHGNAGITLVVSGGAVIRNCDIKNALIGINVKDRNTGGIFANRNPSDNDTTVPLSGFGKTGNHLIEHNRIHDNVLGLFFESSWDLGSTVRYNLIFSNKFQGTVTSAWLGSFSDGSNFHPAAFMFKDAFLSPVAIYNNTLWDNYANFIGHWNTGGQHMIFNNIFSNSNPAGPNMTYMEISYKYPNRMNNNLMSGLAADRIQVQCQGNYASTPYDPSGGCFIADIAISNDIGGVQRTNVTVQTTQPGQTQNQQMVLPGAVIGGTAPNAFAANANNRWLQTAGGTFTGHGGASLILPNLFQSIDPMDPKFLEPRWDHELVQQFVRQQGWGQISIRNPYTGNIADLGAKQHNPNNSGDIVIGRLKPSNVVIVSGVTATANIYFSVENSATFNNARIKFIRWISPIPVPPSATTPDGSGDTWWSNTFVNIPASSVNTINNVPTTQLNVNSNNSINFTLPSAIPAGANTTYGFFEMVVEGEDGNGKTISSDVGFMPYRTLEYFLRIEVLNAAGTAVLSTVEAGQPVQLRVTPVRVQGGIEVPFTSGPLKEIEFTLFSDAVARMWNVSDNMEFTNVKNHNGTQVYNIYFKRAADELISGAGLYEGGGQYLSFLGVSEIKVTPGPAAKIAFVNPIPRSQLSDLERAPAITPGGDFSVVVEVRDRFDNPVNTPSTVNISVTGFSTAERNVGTVGPSSATSDTTGKAVFTANVDK